MAIVEVLAVLEYSVVDISLFEVVTEMPPIVDGDSSLDKTFSVFWIDTVEPSAINVFILVLYTVTIDDVLEQFVGNVPSYWVVGPIVHPYW